MRLRSRALLAIFVLSAIVVPRDAAPIHAAERQSIEFHDINPDFGSSLSGIAGWQDLCESCPGGGSGGRVNGMEIVADEPWRVLAASELGGLFQSTNFGSTWTHVDGHLPTRMRDVEVGLTTGLGRGRVETIYATSRDDFRLAMHSGIQVSRDRGATWSKANLGSAPSSCGLRDRIEAWEIAVRPDNQKQVFVGTSCGIAHTNDAGQTWSLIDPTPDIVSGPNQGIYSVEVMDGGQAWACGDEGVMASPNGVDYWARVTSPGGFAGFCSIAVSPYEGYNVFVAVNGRHFETIDGGQTWTLFSSVDPGGAKFREPFVRTNPMGFLNDGGGGSFQLWLGDGNLWRADCTADFAFGGVLRCPHSRSDWGGTYTDGNGEQTKAHGDGATVEFDPLPVGACPKFYASDGGVYRNVNGMDCHNPDFQDSMIGLHAQWLWGMSGHDDPMSIRQDLVMGLQDNGIFATGEAHLDTPDWEHPIGGDAFDAATDGATTFVSLYATDTNRNAIGALTRGGFGYSNPAAVNKPDDRWISQFRVPEAIDSWAPGNFVVAAKTLGGTGGATQAGLYVTSQPTANPIPWTRIGPPWPATATEPCGVKTSVRNGNPYFFVMAGDCDEFAADQVWLLEPGATQWRRIDTQAGGLGIGIFEVDPTNPDRMFASIWTGTRWQMMRTTNQRTPSGNPWIVDSALQDVMIRGLFRPLPTLVAIDPLNPLLMVAGGEESGVFVSSDGGRAWAPMTETETPNADRPHLPRPVFGLFNHGPTSLDSIFIGTQGRGVWRIGPSHTDLTAQIQLIRFVCQFACKQDVCLTCPISPADKLKLLINPANLGPAMAPNPVLRAELPAGLRFRSIRAPADWSCATPPVGASGSVVCEGPDLAPSAQMTMQQDDAPFEVEIDVAQDAPLGGVLSMPVTVASAAIDTDVMSNGVEFANPVMRLADLQLVGESSPSQGFVGRETVYTVRVNQAGPDGADDVVLTAGLAPGVEVRSVTGASCDTGAAVITCSLGRLDTGQSRTVHVRGVPRLAGDSPLQVAVTATQADLDPGDNFLAVPYRSIADPSPPDVSILRPTGGVYLFDAPFAFGGLPVIAVGPLGVIAGASDPESGVYRVGFTVDGVPVDPAKVAYDAETGQFSFMFAGAPGRHTIVAYALNGGLVRGETAFDVLSLTLPNT